MDASPNSNQSALKQPSTILDALAVSKKQSVTESGQLDFFPDDSDSSSLSSEDFERKVRKIIEQHTPFSTLSNILLFNASQAQLSDDSDEQPTHSIFACEIDHLLHQRLNDIDVLIVVECKNQPVIAKDDENWLVHYVRRNSPITGRFTRNVQYQLQRQAEALRAILKPLGGGRHLRVEACVVSSDPMTELRTRRVDGWLTLHLVSEESFGQAIKNLAPPPLQVVQSEILELLRLAIPVRELGHPEMPNAIAYIDCCRRSLDAEFFERFNQRKNRGRDSLVKEKLRLNYRSPFAVYAASLGLLFRWFANCGPKVIPSHDDLENGFGFSVGDVCENPTLNLSICGHLHPANSWSNCIRTFPNCEAALAMLRRWRFCPEDVLWIRFADKDGTFDYEQLNCFTYRHPNSQETVALADKDVRCQDFPVVVIEGFSEDIDSWKLLESEQTMWRRRKELYLYASRATAFLFIIPRTSLSGEEQMKDEVAEMVRQLSSPTKENNGFDWTWRFAIDPTEEIRGLKAFTDAT